MAKTMTVKVRRRQDAAGAQGAATRVVEVATDDHPFRPEGKIVTAPDGQRFSCVDLMLPELEVVLGKAIVAGLSKIHSRAGRFEAMGWTEDDEVDTSFCVRAATFDGLLTRVVEYWEDLTGKIWPR